MNIKEIASRVADIGGRAYLVGGAVRDKFLGRENHDEDVVVVGVSLNEFQRAFPKAFQTGNLFPVWRLGEIEVALARREKKSGVGHNGFSVEFDSSVSLEDDLRRRDFSMNAIAQDILSNDIIDPFGGQLDIKNGVLAEVDEAHFGEDPLRVLRAARFVAQLGFEPSESLKKILRDKSLLDEVAKLPKERVWGEMRKALEAPRPSLFFRVLEECGALAFVFPELSVLRGQTQPEDTHPEGDAFEHSMIVLDLVSKKTDSLEARFAALVHDIGKGVTPKESLPRHHAHDKAGAEIISQMNPERFPRRLRKVAECVARWHMSSHNFEKVFAEGRIPVDGLFKVLDAVKKADCEETFRLVCEADGSSAEWLDALPSVFAPLDSSEIPVKGDIRGQVIAIRKRRIKQAFSA